MPSDNREIKLKLYHEDLEKREDLLGGCGVVARERLESHVSQ